VNKCAPPAGDAPPSNAPQTAPPVGQDPSSKPPQMIDDMAACIQEYKKKQKDVPLWTPDQNARMGGFYKEAYKNKQRGLALKKVEAATTRPTIHTKPLEEQHGEEDEEESGEEQKGQHEMQTEEEDTLLSLTLTGTIACTLPIALNAALSITLDIALILALTVVLSCTQGSLTCPSHLFQGSKVQGTCPSVRGAC
jgi:hypothetical protein